MSAPRLVFFLALMLPTAALNAWTEPPSGGGWSPRTSSDSESTFTTNSVPLPLTPPTRRTFSSLNMEVLGAIDAGRCYETNVQGHILYSGFSEVFQSFDISDPANPGKLCSLVMPDIVNGIAVRGRFAYVSAATGGLRVVDVFHPDNMYEVYEVPSLERSREVVTYGSYLYLSDGAGGVGIFSLADPAHPVEVARWPTTSARHVSFDGTTAYVSDGNAGVIVLDVANPAAPALLGAFNTPGEASATAPYDHYLCVADGGGGFRILDVADPANIAEVGTTSTYVGEVWDVAVDGLYAYLACTYRGAAVADISTPAFPVIVSSPDDYFGAYGHDIDIAGDLLFLAHNYTGMAIIGREVPDELVTGGSLATAGRANDVVIRGNLAYVAVDSSGLRIVDVTDPARPYEIGFYDTPGAGHGVDVVGNRAYLCDGNGGLLILNVSNPQAPALLGTYPSVSALGVEVVNDVAYVAGGSGGLYVIDVANPASPHLLGRKGMIYGYSHATEVDVSGNYAYLAEGTAGLAIIDISNPQSMSLTEYHYQTYGVTVVGNLAYLSCAGNGLYIVDVSVPTSPVQIGSYSEGYYTGNGPMNAAIVGTRAYVAQNTYGFIVVDITDPTNTFRVWDYGTPGNPMDVAVANGHAFIADQLGGLQIIGVDAQAKLTQVSKYDTDGSIVGTAISGTHAFTLSEYYATNVVAIQNPRRTTVVAGPLTGSPHQMRPRDELGFLSTFPHVRIYNIADPSQPVELSRFLSRRRVIDQWNEDSLWAYSSPWDAVPVGNHLLVAYYGDSLTTRDISDPSNPVQVASFRTSLPMREMAVAGDYAYIAAWDFGLVVFDVRDPTDIDSVATLPTSGRARAVAVWGDLAFIGNHEGGVDIIDISDPLSPTGLSSFATTGSAFDVDAYNNFVYLSEWDYGLHVLDVLQPQNPIEVGHYTTRAPRGVTAHGDRVFLSDYETGTLILRNTLPPTHVDTPEPGWTLMQNFPNPFNPQTAILFSTPGSTHARIVVYDVAGRRVKTLLNGPVGAGSHRVAWDGRNDRGQMVASGVYFYRLDAEGVSIARKMVLLR